MNKIEVHIPNQVFNLSGPITSCVCTQEEFDGVCDFIEEVVVRDPPMNAADGKRFQKKDIDLLRKNKHIPLIAKGTLTKAVFEKYDVETNLVSFIVRGQGERLLGKLFGN